MSRILVLVIVLLFTAIAGAIAQRRFISGAVFDKSTMEALEGASIQLLALKDSSIRTVASRKGGVFSFSEVPPGSYQLETKAMGYSKLAEKVTVENKDVFQSFRLDKEEILIEEIAIEGRAAVRVKGDTTEFDATRYSTREYADADELVSQIPGVVIDEDGNVVAQGEPVSRIIVDGKEFFSTDPKVALKTLPADVIDKIQLIDERSEQARFSGFDDGQRNKIINIVTKPDRRRGYFGRATAGKGGGDKYSLNSGINYFNNSNRLSLMLMANNINETDAMEMGRGRFGGRRGGNSNTGRGISDTYQGSANYNNSFLKDKMNLSGNYRFNWNGTEVNTISATEYLQNNRANQFQDQVMFSNNRGSGHDLRAKLEWDVDPKNRLTVEPTFRYNSTNNFNNNSSTTSLNQTELINQTARSNNAENSTMNIGGNVAFMHKLKKDGRTISLNFSGNSSSNDAVGLNLATTEYYQEALLNRIDTNNNRSVTNGYNSGVNARVSFTENISTLSRLQVNTNYRNTASYSDRETFEFLAETGQLGELRDRLSNEFRNDFNFYSGGLSYLYNKKDTLRIQVGLNYQYGMQVNNRTVPVDLVTRAGFGSWLPEFTVAYYLSKTKNFEFNYNTSTNTPSIDQLQDFVNNQNELRVTNGNPDLNQEYSHRFKLQYRDINRESGRSVNTNVNFDLINDRIVNSVILTDTIMPLFDDVFVGAGGQYSVPVNMDGSYNVRVTNSYGVPLNALKLNMNLNTNLFFNNNLGMVNKVNTKSQSYGFSQGVSMNTNINPRYIASLSYTINANYTRNPLNVNPMFNVYTHQLSSNINLEPFKNILIQSNVMYLYNGGINGQEGIGTTVWNASVGYRIFKKRDGEIGLKAYDLLNNAQNVNRTVNQISASNTQSNTLNRYFLLSLTYNLRNFGGRPSGQGRQDFTPGSVGGRRR